MDFIFKDKLTEFQELIDYKFKNEDLLKEALTTPQLAHQLEVNDYNFLETLGDSIIKVIFITKLYRDGIKDPGKITKIKQRLENDDTLRKIAKNEMELDKFVLKSKKQRLKGTKILADVFEAICGAIFLDSGYDIKIVEEKIIAKFFSNFNSIIKESKIFQKSRLIEYLQKKHRITPHIECEYINKGSDHAPKWIAKNPKIHPKSLLIELPENLKSRSSKSIQEAEQDLYEKIYYILKNVKTLDSN
ncbi:MAG: ribonuclease III domain-containing protein [Promethearchaeota archaeon]